MGLNRLFWRPLFALAERKIPNELRRYGHAHCNQPGRTDPGRQSCQQELPPAPNGDDRWSCWNGVDFSLKEGELVGLLGRSGCGKSTLLRLIAGLSAPKGGAIDYLGRAGRRPAAGHRHGVPELRPVSLADRAGECGGRAGGHGCPGGGDAAAARCAAIDLIGLDGYESAFPRELSGGMRQRVGFARAVVTHPNILLMDEPFSAPGRADRGNPAHRPARAVVRGPAAAASVLLVTHNIEEAVLMCDRILLFASNPGQDPPDEIRIDLPHPRSRTTRPSARWWTTSTAG